MHGIAILVGVRPSEVSQQINQKLKTNQSGGGQRSSLNVQVFAFITGTRLYLVLAAEVSLVMADDAEAAAFWTDVDATADEAEVADEAEAWQFASSTAVMEKRLALVPTSGIPSRPDWSQLNTLRQRQRAAFLAEKGADIPKHERIAILED